MLGFRIIVIIGIQYSLNNVNPNLFIIRFGSVPLIHVRRFFSLGDHSPQVITII